MNDRRNADTSNWVEICFMLNGEQTRIAVRPWDSALKVLRDDLKLTGAKEGCGIGECGACTIIVNGKAVNSCLMLGPQLHETEVRTIEGLGTRDMLHPIQQAFLDAGAVQCGFCTPGVVLAAAALLDRNPNPSRDQVVEALAGNLCRCTGYQQIVNAVLQVARNHSLQDGRH